MIWRVDVFPKEEQGQGELISQVKDLGITREFKPLSRKVYLIEADLSQAEINLIAKSLLIDPVVEAYSAACGIFAKPPQSNQILITYNPGVCDNVALSLDKAIKDLALEVKAVRTARLYCFEGLDSEDIDYLAPKLLYNPLIEHPLSYEAAKHLETLDEFAGRDYQFELVNVDMLSASDRRLEDISQKGCLSLSLPEMKIIAGYFKKAQRNPTDCELETIATLWSEHCAHKTFRGVIDYQEQDEQGKVTSSERIDNLLKTTVMKATKEINSPDCVSVFSDNSGVVNFDEKNNICFKVETHNHPSSLEPYGGAATGIGGVIRDVLGTGAGARPFASVDIFCFAPWDIAYKDLPPGLLHPKRIIKGVVGGVRDYGNRMGIPTVAGSVLFDQRFLGNPLVYCGTLGILPKEKSFKEVKSGDLVILCGAPTGRDGIHGATFSSKELDETTVSLTSAVQIGNPIEEKKLTEALLRARDKDLFRAITDCGAGGISSAVTELAAGCGVEVWLDKVPLKYRGLTYTEIWISESQERMVFFAPEGNLEKLEEIFAEEEVNLTVIGRTTSTKKLVLFYQGHQVGQLDMDFIFNLPRLEKKAVWVKRPERPVRLKEKPSYNQDLKDLLSAPNIACKDWILRQYDHEVQAGSVLKSIYGVVQPAVSDGACLRPDLASDKCVTVGLGINPFYSDLDPYWMAALAIDEALRNVVACGGRLDKTFILDNFSWGSPQDEKILGDLVRAARACYDFSTYFKVPFISGKDSLYNEYTLGDKRIAIPATLLISAVAVMDSWQQAIGAQFKQAGSLIYLVGFTRPQLGASQYFRNQGLTGGVVPKIDQALARPVLEGVSRAGRKGLIESCHDLSEGGLAVALAEMAMGSSRGADIFLEEVPAAEGMADYEVLFSESPSRFIVEVDPKKRNKFEKELEALPLGLIGCVAKSNAIVVQRPDKEVINIDTASLTQAWTAKFDEFRFIP